jgi:autotransporter-associated beta strand protein
VRDDRIRGWALSINLPSWERRRSVARICAGALFAAVTVLLSPNAARAQSSTWNGSTSAYATPGNWSPSSGGPPYLPGQSAIFGSTGSTTINVDNSAMPTPFFMQPDSWTFSANAQSFTISGDAIAFSVSGPSGGIINNANTGQIITIGNNINDGAVFVPGTGFVGVPVRVQQFGNSTLVLSGANGYTGGTLISAGTVQVTNTNSVGTGAVTLDNGGMFQLQSGTVGFINNFAINAGGGTIDNHGGVLTISGVISDGTGPGLLTLIGTGVTELSGVNTYTSGTLVNGTTLVVSNNSSVGTGAVTLNNAIFQADGVSSLTFANNFKLTGGNVIDANGTTLTIAGNISGAGSVEYANGGGPSFIAPGTVVLLGTNTYTGGTLICSCTTLQLGDSMHTASIIGTVDVEGRLNVVNADTSGITSIFNEGFVKFRNATSASQIQIANAGRIDFLDTATAANSTILNGGGLITFNSSATAGKANVINEFGGEIDFFNTATAANATIVNQTGGLLTFNNSASAGSANITNQATGETDFYGGGTAGNATIVNQSEGATTFQLSSTAGNANITNLTGGQLFFYDNSSAGNAIITNNSSGNNANPVPEGVFFTGASTAGNATIINNTGGAIDFGYPGSTDTATAGNANITNNAGSTLQFSAFTTAGNAIITTQSGSAVAFFNHSTGANASSSPTAPAMSTFPIAMA